MSGRVLVPWKEILDELDDRELAAAGLRAEVFSGDEPGPGDLDDVVFFTVPYDRPYGTEPLGRMPGVRVVQALTAGYEHLTGRIPDGTALCNARGLHDSSTAELALALILAAQRELTRWVRAQDARRWEHAHTRSLAGSRVLIVGYGSIGAALDARLRACEADVVRVARRPRPGADVYAVADLDRLLPSADAVVLVTPLTEETRGLLDARRLALLPDGALVVNVGRGPVLDTGAMVAEASAGRLARGAGRDRPGTATGRSSALGLPGCAHHPARGRGRRCVLPARGAVRRRADPAVRVRRAPAERGRARRHALIGRDWPVGGKPARRWRPPCPR